MVYTDPEKGRAHRRRKPEAPHPTDAQAPQIPSRRKEAASLETVRKEREALYAKVVALREESRRRFGNIDTVALIREVRDRAAEDGV